MRRYYNDKLECMFPEGRITFIWSNPMGTANDTEKGVIKSCCEFEACVGKWSSSTFSRESAQLASWSNFYSSSSFSKDTWQDWQGSWTWPKEVCGLVRRSQLIAQHLFHTHSLPCETAPSTVFPVTWSNSWIQLPPLPDSVPLSCCLCPSNVSQSIHSYHHPVSTEWPNQLPQLVPQLVSWPPAAPSENESDLRILLRELWEPVSTFRSGEKVFPTKWFLERLGVKISSN